MEDLAGLLFLFGAIVVASVAIVVEAAVPPSRPAIGRYLALHAVLLLYATVVFGQYLVSQLNGSVAVVSVLRSMEYALAPLSAIVVAWWARVVVSTGRRMSRWFLAYGIVGGALSGASLAIVHMPSLGFAALLVLIAGRLMVLHQSLRVALLALRARAPRVAIPFLLWTLYWVGLSAIEGVLVAAPERLSLLNAWYTAAAGVYLGGGAVLIVARRRIPVGGHEEATVSDDAPRDMSRDAADTLTAREREVALLLSEGLTYQVIADRLHVSYGTVKTHVYRIYRKLGVGSKTALVRALEPPVPQGNEPRANGVSAD